MPRRRSPEAARNRLAGFQLGSRDAAQAGSTPGWTPYAGEENEPLSSPYRQDLNWLVTDFTTRVADIAHAIVVSADGVPLALSAGIPYEAVEQFSAITSGLTSLIRGAAQDHGGGQPMQALVEMDRGLMFVKAISDGSALAVLTAPECDTRQISYEMTRLVEAVGELLTPAARTEA